MTSRSKTIATVERSSAVSVRTASASAGGPLETTTIRVHRQSQTAPDGTTSVLVSFDLSGAPVPSRRYVAESAAVNRSDYGVELAFAQHRRDGSGAPRSMVIVSVTPDCVHQFLESSAGFRDLLSSFSAQYQLPTVPLRQLNQEPASAVTLSANVLMAAYAGHSACIDCFSISPWAFRSVSHTEDLAIEPVVRIELPTALLDPILNRLAEIRSTLPPRAL
jgi:hypothetical protein